MERLGQVKTWLLLSLLLLFMFTPVLAGPGSGGLPATNDPGRKGSLGETWPPPVWVDTVQICLGDSIIDTTDIWVDDYEDPNVTLDLYYGHGVFTVERPGLLRGIYKHLPPYEGEWEVWITLVSYGEILEAYKYIYMVYDNAPPEIDDQYFSTSPCDIVESRQLQIEAYDLEGDPLNFVILSGVGAIDPVTGLLTYYPDTSGVYHWLVEVSGICGSDTAHVYDTLEMNHPPVIVCPDDTTFYTCVLDTFCFTVDTYDPDGESLTINVISPTSGVFVDGQQVCVIGSESAQVDVVVEVVDECGLADTCSVIVTIEGNRPPLVTIPETYDITLCDTTLICIPDCFVSDPDFDITDIHVNYGYYESAANRICLQVDSTGTYVIVLTATDSCEATDADTMIVTAGVNETPVVDLGEDFEAYLCGQTSICVPVTIIDDNVATVLPNLGSYNSQTGEVCFEPDTAGLFTLIVTVTDECDEQGSDTVNITVELGGEPFIDLGNDTSGFWCQAEEICIGVSTIPVFKQLYTSLGIYNDVTAQICFTPDTSGVYTLIAQVTDSCDFVAADTVYITVDLNDPPVLSHMPDSELYLCQPQLICLPLDAADPDGNMREVTVNRGTYADGQVCFVPYDSGTYQIIATAIDSCDEATADTAYVIVDTDQEIELICPNDTTIFVCELDTLCFPVDVPEGYEVTVQGIGAWWDEATGQVCFYAECETVNRIQVSIETPCGVYSCDFTVRLICNDPPLVILPQDTTLVLCEPGQLCLPVGISDQDGNLMSVEVEGVEGAVYYAEYDRICFDADGPGSYTIEVTATDSCLATDTDVIHVEVVGNTPPWVSPVLTDTVFASCGPEDICIPVEAGDVDDNLREVISSLGYYDAQQGTVCFTPDTSGRYCITVTAIDECDATDDTTFCIIVETGNWVEIECPPWGPVLECCELDTLCTSLELYISGSPYEIITSYGWILDGNLCIAPETCGVYDIDIIANADCNSDTCVFHIEVVLIEPPQLTCGTKAPVFLCEPDTLCYGFAVTPAGTPVTIVSPPQAYIEGNQVCVPILESGEIYVELEAVNQCGIDNCAFSIEATINTCPVLSIDDTSLTVCELTEICVPFTVYDPDDNLDSVTTTLGEIIGSEVCFTPTAFQTYEIVLTAYDACNAIDVDTSYVEVIEGGQAQFITCPEGKEYPISLCGPDTVCLDTVPGFPLILVTPADAEITVLGNGVPNGVYDPLTGRLCVHIAETGVLNVTIIADAGCGADTCSFIVNSEIVEPPVVSCPGRIDTTMCLGTRATLCYPVTVEGTGVVVTVTPPGTFENDSVCYPINSAGDYEIVITAENQCELVACTTEVHVEADQMPVLHLPEDRIVEVCPGDSTLICIDSIWGSDVESDVDLMLLSNGGYFEFVSGDTGRVCFVADTVGQYLFWFRLTDGCHILHDVLMVEVVEGPDCDVCVRLFFEETECTPVGVMKDVNLMIETNDRIGGFDLLLNYDPSALTFQSSSIGEAITGWEYFTHNLISPGMVRFVAIADMNNGAHHPPPESLQPEGVLVNMQFYVANNQTLEGQYVPIRFVWFDCGDNTFSDPTGQDLFIDLRILSHEGLMIWDEDDDDNFPEENRLFNYQGAPDDCLAGGKVDPIRCIEFFNGGVDICEAESLDVRGDINLNEIPYEIGDGVLFTNYFVYGLSVFTVNVAGQIAATDVNADGLTLSVADLVLLIRIIVGDADPIPKLVPYEEELSLCTRQVDGLATVGTDAVSDIGAVYLVYDIGGDLSINDVGLLPAANDMDLMWAVNEGKLKLLVFNIGPNRIAPGKHDIVSVELGGSGELLLEHSEVVDYHGRPYKTSASDRMPRSFALNQNYPNPFNPSTTISFSLGEPGDWRLCIYNVTGRLVREFTGSSGSGDVTIEWHGKDAEGYKVASGVYFYRLEASDFMATKKMLLLK